MKIRLGYVTNSSSSSFIISKDQLSLEQVLEFIKQYQTKNRLSWSKNGDMNNVEELTITDVGKVTMTDHIKTVSWPTMNVYDEKSKDLPYVYDSMEREDLQEGYPEGFWLFSNDTTIRFNWDTIDEICNYFNCDYQLRHCD